MDTHAMRFLLSDIPCTKFHFYVDTKCPCRFISSRIKHKKSCILTVPGMFGAGHFLDTCRALKKLLLLRHFKTSMDSILSNSLVQFYPDNKVFPSGFGGVFGANTYFFSTSKLKNTAAFRNLSSFKIKNSYSSNIINRNSDIAEQFVVHKSDLSFCSMFIL